MDDPNSSHFTEDSQEKIPLGLVDIVECEELIQENKDEK